MNEPAFRTRTAALVVAAVGASFLGWVLVHGLSQDTTAPDGRPDGYDRSALGHVALVRLLQEVGTPVLHSRHDSGRRAGRDGVLLVLEPQLDDGGPRTQALQRMLAEARRALVVLPKWRRADGSHDDWAREVVLLPVEEVQHVLATAGVHGFVGRQDAAVERWTDVSPERSPDLAHFPVQSVTAGRGRERVRFGSGALVTVAALGDRTCLVLSDPDVLSNAGLHRPPNAAFVVELVESLRQGRGTIVVDETLHGMEQPPSLTRDLVTPPLVYASIHLAAALLVLAWAAGARFGAPEPAPALLPAGVRGLVQTTAELLREGGHLAPVLPRYLAGVVEQVRLALHAPATLAGEALEEWVDGIAASRGARERLAHLREAVRRGTGSAMTGAAALALAARIDTWRREVLDGREGRSRAA
jgi:hypothetical protein